MPGKSTSLKEQVAAKPIFQHAYKLLINFAFDIKVEKNLTNTLFSGILYVN